MSWFRRIKKHPWRFVAIVFLAGVVALNGLAYMHAHAMTHYVESSRRTPSPEDLSIIDKMGVLVGGVRVPRPEQKRKPDSINLPYSVLELSAADGTKLEAWHVSAPDARGLCLMFHGYAECKSQLLTEASEFRDLQLSVMLVNFRGSGGSAGSVTTVGFREADDVVAAVGYAREHFPDLPLLLYGRSMGSVAVLRAISERGLEPDGIILECPFDCLLSTVENRFASMNIPSFPSAELLVFWGGLQHGYSGFAHNPLDYAHNVTCPALVMTGDRDPRATLSQVRSVYENLAGVKRFVSFKGIGHEPYLSEVPEQWRSAVGEFGKLTLNKIEKQPSPNGSAESLKFEEVE